METDEKLRLLERRAIETNDPIDIYIYRLTCVNKGHPHLAGFWRGDEVRWRKLDRFGNVEKTPWGTETSIKRVQYWALASIMRYAPDDPSADERGHVLVEEWAGLWVAELSPWDKRWREGVWFIQSARPGHLTLLEPCPAERMDMLPIARVPRNPSSP